MSVENNLSKNVKFTRVMDAVAAGTSAQTSSIIDMAGFDGVLFVVAVGTLTATAVTSIKVQQGAVANMSDAADLEGSQQDIAADDDDQLAGVDVWRPQERYVRAIVGRGTANAVIDGVVAIQYKARNRPTTQDVTTVVGITFLQEPAEGTA